MMSMLAGEMADARQKALLADAEKGRLARRAAAPRNRFQWLARGLRTDRDRVVRRPDAASRERPAPA
jgi:hypothetical protein